MLLNVAFSCEENRRMSYVIHTWWGKGIVNEKEDVCL
jgi:hypothetical protein